MAAERKGGSKHVPPDGGWGWMVVFGFSINNIIAIPILQGFGLLFRDVFRNLGISAKDSTLIINTNSAFGLLLGLLNGPLLRYCGYRKAAIVGALILFIGNVLTSTASSFTEFMIYYGVINSIGLTWTLTAFSVALNTYFVKRRSNAQGICMTATGLGPVIMPLVISWLMGIYGVRGTAFILAALSLHSLFGALLLQPIKWHYKTVPEEEDEEKCGEDKKDEEEEAGDDVESVYCIEATLVPRRLSNASDVRRSRQASVSKSQISLDRIDESLDRIKPEDRWWSNSRLTLNQKSQDDLTAQENSNNLKINNIYKVPKETMKEESKVLLTPHAKENLNNVNKSLQKSIDKMAMVKEKWYQKIVRIFDLDLLKDPVYVSIWFGMSIAFTGEVNFSLLTPFILGDRNFDIETTALIMSVLATADIIFRFITPFVGNRTNLSARQLYLISLVLLVITRSLFTVVYSYNSTLIVAVALGIAKGIRSVYMGLVIPNHVPIEKLPSASGLQTVLNGIFIMMFAPVIGYVRDWTGSYNYCIYIMNLLTLTTIILWTIEFLVFHKKQHSNVNGSVH